MFIIKPLLLYKKQNGKFFNKDSRLEVNSKLHNENELNNTLNLI